MLLPMTAYSTYSQYQFGEQKHITKTNDKAECLRSHENGGQNINAQYN